MAGVKGKTGIPIKFDGDAAATYVTHHARVTELTEQHTRIMNMLLGSDTIPPMTKGEVAAIMGVSLSTITHITKAPMFSQKLRERKLQRERTLQAAQERFQDMVPAVQEETLNLALDSGNESIRLSACKDWLDRAGLKPDNNVNIRGILVTADYSDTELSRVVASRLKVMGLLDEGESDENSNSGNGDAIDSNDSVCNDLC